MFITFLAHLNRCLYWFHWVRPIFLLGPTVQTAPQTHTHLWAERSFVHDAVKRAFPFQASWGSNHAAPALTFTCISHHKAADSCRPPSAWCHCHGDQRAAGGIIFTEYALTFSKHGSGSVDNSLCYDAFNCKFSHPFIAIITIFSVSLVRLRVCQLCCWARRLWSNIVWVCNIKVQMFCSDWYLQQIIV